MKAIITTLAVIALTSICITSCEKSDNDTVLKITTKPFVSDGKTTFNGSSVIWEEGDYININGQRYRVSVDGSNISVPGVQKADDYYAAYPADIDFSGGSSTITGAPTWEKIFAHASTGNPLNFQSPYAIMAITIINNTGETLENVTLSIANSKIGYSGQHTISESDITGTSTSPSVSANIPNGGIPNGQEGTVQLFIMPCGGQANSREICVSCTNSDLSIFSKYNLGADPIRYNFNRNTIYTMTVELTDGDGE